MAIFCCFGYDVSNPEEERNVSVGSPVLPEYRNDASSSSSATSSVAGEEPVNVEKEEADEINLKHVLEFSTTSSKVCHGIDLSSCLYIFISCCSVQYPSIRVFYLQ